MSPSLPPSPLLFFLCICVCMCACWWLHETATGWTLLSKDTIGSKVKIRLRGGRAKEEGRVEVKIGDNSKPKSHVTIHSPFTRCHYLVCYLLSSSCCWLTVAWGLICGDGWSLFEAGVVCRELGLGYAQNALQTDFFGGNRSSIALSGVQCHGSERSLEDCLHGSGSKREVSCPGKKDNIAGVVCASGTIFCIKVSLKCILSGQMSSTALLTARLAA